MDNLALGLMLGYDKTNYKGDGVNDPDASTLFGLFGRYYVNGKIPLGLSFGSRDNGSASGSIVGLEGGYAIFLNNAIAIEPTLNFYSFGGDFDGSAFGLNVGITAFLGRGE